MPPAKEALSSSHLPLRPVATHTPPAPSIALLFSYCSRRDVIVLLLPAICASLVAGGIAPLMTRIIGNAFNALATFPATSSPTEHEKHKLLHDVGMVALELIGLALGSLALSSLVSSLWLWVGERIVMRVRSRVFVSVTSRDMEWFDLLGGGGEAKNPTTEDEVSENLGAGGLMANFTRDTDDVRTAVSLNSGMIIQYLTSFVTALIFAFDRSWSLTLVILSSIPIMVFVQAFSQSLSMTSFNAERSNTARAATGITRAIASISTVKAFNATFHEVKSVSSLLDAAQVAYHKCCVVWGAAGGSSHLLLFSMFVQGFWYGAKLVRWGHISPGDVVTVFWACQIASSNLQMCMPLLIILTKGKSAMASLETIIHPPPREDHSADNDVTPPPYHESCATLSPLSNQPQQHQKEVRRPSICLGTFDIQGITFSYPSRPTVPVLSLSPSFPSSSKSIPSIHIAGNDLTFIVGGSGSGKSTLAQLLMGMYTPSSGRILFDEIPLDELDPAWKREHIALVSQECILFDMSVHDNVAIGLAGSSTAKPENVTRDAVEHACRIAMVHDFVKDLPDGYETLLGNGGSNLSGGQRQRVALARAILRDPTVLILDEATSALDATSRVLVFEAIKQVRRRKTTVVITHDLSQIMPEDYVYVMRSGCVVEEGFREDLEKSKDGEGEFRKTLEKQFESGGFPVRESLPDTYDVVRTEAAVAVDRIMNKHTSMVPDVADKRTSMWMSASASRMKHTTILGAGFEVGSRTPWEVDAIADILGPSSLPAVPIPKNRLSPYRLRGRYESSSARPTPLSSPSSCDHSQNNDDAYSMQDVVLNNNSTTSLPSPSVSNHQDLPHRRSMTFEPSLPSPTYARSYRRSVLSTFDDIQDDLAFDAEKSAMEASARHVTSRRRVSATPRGTTRTNWGRKHADIVVVATNTTESTSPPVLPVPSFGSLARRYYHTVPAKLSIFLGLVFSFINGASTPVFAYLLARVLSEIGGGSYNTSTLSKFALLSLLVAFVDGISSGLQFYLLENAGMKWVVSLRKRCFAHILAQDRAFFDESKHSPERLVQILIKDGDDARTIIATIIGQTIVVTTMLLVGMVWALVRGWQVTLAGVAIAPVFAAAMMAQNIVASKFEVRNKRAREEIARRYYEAVNNVRAIRSMALESVFARRFDESLESAMSTGVQGAFVAGLGFGVANSLVYLAQALLFYVGAALMARGTYSYQQLLEVLNLVTFSVCIAAQLLTFVPKMAKAKQAAADFGQILELSTETAESRGSQRFAIHGDVSFEHVSFLYAQRPDVPVLNDMSGTIRTGESVAIVGASGSGKSTMGALLQRLYEPTTGRITIGGHNIKDADCHWLRHHVAVVSQVPALFDCTIAENISYGCEPGSVCHEDIERAARDAHLHDFIMSLPKGYDTLIGEKASLLSGGQAQRLQIARALVNGRASILIFDECTSALDSTNQAAVMSTINQVKTGRTSILITHKLAVMQMCDRILVVDGGRLVEDGTYDQLIQRRGTFFNLASAGEWAEVE